MMSEGGLSVLANDIRYASAQAQCLENDILKVQFEELAQVIQVLQSPDPGSYLDLDYRGMKYHLVRPRTLSLIIPKILKCMNSSGRNSADLERRASLEEVLTAVSRGSC